MRTLNTIVMIVSFLSIIFFIGVALMRLSVAKKQAKKYGMKKQVTDPWLYWISYSSGIVIIIIKVFIWTIFGPETDTDHNLLFSEIIPSLALFFFTRTIGRSVILRAEKHLYFNNLLSETKDIHKFVKEDKDWMLYTATGKYPVALSNTTIIKIADITGAKIEKGKESTKAK